MTHTYTNRLLYASGGSTHQDIKRHGPYIRYLASSNTSHSSPSSPFSSFFSFLFHILSNHGCSFTPSFRNTVSAFQPEISEPICLKNFSLSVCASLCASKILSLNTSTSAVCNPALVPESVLEPQVLFGSSRRAEIWSRLTASSRRTKIRI